MICPNCKGSISPGSKFCPECGLKVSQVCSCGASLIGNEKFCPECGNRILVASPAFQQPSQEQSGFNPPLADTNVFLTTILNPMEGEYTHKTSDQFAKVQLRVEPIIGEYPNKFKCPFPIIKHEKIMLPWEGRLALILCTDNIDSRFAPAMQRGILNELKTGVEEYATYLTNIVVFVYDGKMHPIDSNEESFEIAAQNAFSLALSEAEFVKVLL